MANEVIVVFKLVGRKKIKPSYPPPQGKGNWRDDLLIQPMMELEQRKP